MSFSFRRAAAVAAAVLMSSCASTSRNHLAHSAPNPSGHIEAVAKSAGHYELLANGRVRIDTRGSFVLDHQDDTHLYIVIYDVPTMYNTTFGTAATSVPSAGSVRDARGTLKLIDIGQGLPHAGQWRDHFAVGDILGDASTQIVFGPPRKSGVGVSAAFREQASGWQRVDLDMPPGRYDYGAVAIGDFDGDGRNDLAMAMHLTGFAVLRARGDGTFERIDAGLPSRADPQHFGSGHAVLALPAAPHEAAPLLLLQEAAIATDPKQKRAPYLAQARYDGKRFIAAPIAAVTHAGDELSYAPASSTCAAKLVVSGGTTGAPLLLQSAAKKKWTARALSAFPQIQTVVSASAVGDVDGDGCSDVAVAYGARVDGVWHSVVDLYLDRGSSWKRINLAESPRGARVVAMTVAVHASGPLLLTLDDDGTLRAYRLGAGAAELVLESTAPDWRRGCAGSDIHVLPGNGSAVHIAASFAGEPSMGQFDRCRKGGGIEAWEIQ